MPGNPAPSEKDCQAIPTNVCRVRGPETPHPAWVPAILARGASVECKHFVKSYDCHVVGCFEFSGDLFCRFKENAVGFGQQGPHLRKQLLPKLRIRRSLEVREGFQNVYLYFREVTLGHGKR